MNSAFPSRPLDYLAPVQPLGEQLGHANAPSFKQATALNLVIASFLLDFPPQPLRIPPAARRVRRMKITDKGQVTIPPAMRRKHGLLPQREVKFVDQPDGILIVKATKLTRGKRVLAALLRGAKVKGNTHDWLRLTRSAA
jgi:bifunctional DNA-binding transcriptional regulator/antitoxin component of YhaV-PrlF toxin-antitoxin module